MMAPLKVRWFGSIAAITAEQWDSLLIGCTAMPFYRWSWLRLLEASQSIVPRQGWQPCHLTVWSDEKLVAVAPLYLKGHSYGEFVFDQSFAELAGQLGLRYYPKLVGMSPLSPVEGYRFFVDRDQDQQLLTGLMLDQIRDFCQQQAVLSCNFLYVDPSWRPLAEACGCAAWINQQTCWTNPGLADFEAYLASFNANQRRNIRRERASVLAAGLSVTALEGEAISAPLLERMHHFYAQHCARWGPWGSKYLSEAFFEDLESLIPDLVLFSAHRGDPGEPLAMAMCLQDGRHLWGRYWGSDVELENLHFEVCYYAPIAWAISRGLKRFDPGAGGSHKRRRGFVAEPRVSLHVWTDHRFDQILKRWLPQANEAALAEIAAVNAELPFRGGLPPLASLADANPPGSP
jgi:predicted N-acyltransferase